jgi:hypothetical protein
MYPVSSSRVGKIAPVGDPRQRPPARGADVVILVGPDQDPNLVAAAERECRAGGLDAVFMGNVREGFHPAQLADLRRSGRIGPNTHVIVIAHGRKSQPDVPEHMRALVPQRPVQHTMTFPQPWSNEPTVELIAGLRLPQGDLPAWTGPLHLISCQVGGLADELQPGSELWRTGSVLLYGGAQDIPANMPNEDLVCLLRFLSECKRHHHVATDMQSFAHLATVTGENVSILGGELEQPVTVPAPRSPADLQPGALEADQLRQKVHAQFEQRSTRRPQGAPSDLKQFAQAVQSSGNTDPRVPAAKMLHVLADHGSPKEVARLLDAFPGLLEVAGPDGRTPLVRALIGKNLAVVELLLLRGANPNVTIAGGRSPLQLAWGHPALMHLLCRFGADPALAKAANGEPLMAAAMRHAPDAAAAMRRGRDAFLASGRPQASDLQSRL